MTGTNVGGPELLVETEGRIRTLVLNRPARANALSRSLRAALVDAFLEAGADPNVWVIVLTGAGEKAFCAGLDLNETGAPDGERAGPLHTSLRTYSEIVADTCKPVIAALNGAAVAGGFELMLACDICVAAEGARLGLTEAKVGMGAAYGSIALPRMIPPAIAYEMMFTGRLLDAAEAARWGLVNKVVPRARLLEEAMSMARQIAANAPLSTQRMKTMARKSDGLPLSAALRLDAGPDPYRSQDRLEGARAFLEKRPPEWKGR